MTTLVLLPGMDGTGFLFEPFVAALGQAYSVRIVRYPTDQTLDHDELDVIARAALPADEPFVLLGESFSGPLAISIAATNPRGLIGVILCASFVANPRPALAWLAPLARIPFFKLMPTWLESVFLLHRFGNASTRALLRKAIGAVDDRVFNARLRIIIDVDVTTALGRCRVPLLYMQPTNDWLVPPSSLEVVRKHYPAVEVAVIEGPHCLLLTSPEPAVAAVDAFLNRLAPASPTA